MIFKQWPLKPLTEVAFFQEGPGLRKWQWTESGMKVINVTNILGDGSVDINNTARFISHEEFENKYRHFAVAEGDIVIASSGNTYGKVGRINRCHLPIMMNTSVIRFHPANPNTLDQDFLYAFLRSHLFKNQMESFVIGSAQPNFGPSHLKQMLIPCPDLPTQRKIAGVLSAYDDLIENNSRRIAILEEMAQAIYREWFVNFRFPGHENVKLIDSPLGIIPEGWERKQLREIAYLRLGKMLDAKKNKGELMPYLANVNLRWGDFELQNLREMRFEAHEIEAYGLKYGDIVMCEGGEPGRCAIWTERIPNMMIQKAIHRIRSLKKVDFRWLYHTLRHKAQTGQLEALFTGATIKHLPREKLDIVILGVPPKILMDDFSRMVESMALQVEVLTKRNEILQKTRDLLLPKLISGQLDVEDLDIEIGEQPEEATT
jgi:type I restriction enzyme S subunit